MPIVSEKFSNGRSLSSFLLDRRLSLLFFFASSPTPQWPSSSRAAFFRGFFGGTDHDPSSILVMKDRRSFAFVRMWRSRNGDFGEDLLRRHKAAER